ncbi:MAG: hypothetical protein OEM52_06895 [bacterium]|nr:hypothetical protein [bacterium]
MKKIFVVTGFACLCLIIATGCGVEVDSSYTTADTNPHPFVDPAVSAHDNYLRTNNYPYDKCFACHGERLDGNGNAAMSCGKCHNDGAGNVTVMNCNFCHGTMSGNPSIEANWAPPRDLSGSLDVTSRGVGRHQLHLTQINPPQGPIPCSGCHVVPTRWDSPGHIDGDNRAEVVEAVGYFPNSHTCIICHGGDGHIWNQ